MAVEKGRNAPKRNTTVGQYLATFGQKKVSAPVRKPAAPKPVAAKPTINVRPNGINPYTTVTKTSPKQPASIVEAHKQAANKPFKPAPVTVPGKKPGIFGGSGGGTTLNKPKPAAPKAPARPSAPVVAGGGSSPSVGSTVTGGGANPAKPAVTTPPGGSAQAAAGIQSFIDQARSSVSAEDLPALNELQRQLDKANAQYKAQSQSTAERGARSQSDLSELFGRLGNFTQQLQGQSQQDYTAIGNSTSDAYRNLQGALNTHFDSGEAKTASELERLGLGSQVQNSNAGSNRDQAFLTGLAANDGTNAVSGLSMQQQGFDNLMNMARNTAGTEGAVRVGQSRRDMENALTQLQAAFNEQQGDIQGKRGDIIATQGQRTRELAEALADKDYARRMEAQQIQFEQQLAMEKFGLDKQQAALAAQAAMAPPAPPDLIDVLRTEKLQRELEADEAARIKAEQDRAFQNAFASSPWGSGSGIFPKRRR